jgi:hypothetical protein
VLDATRTHRTIVTPTSLDIRLRHDCLSLIHRPQAASEGERQVHLDMRWNSDVTIMILSIVSALNLVALISLVHASFVPGAGTNLHGGSYRFPSWFSTDDFFSVSDIDNDRHATPPHAGTNQRGRSSVTSLKMRFISWSYRGKRKFCISNDLCLSVTLYSQSNLSL